MINDLMSKVTMANNTDWQYNLVSSCSHFHLYLVWAAYSPGQRAVTVSHNELSPSAVFPPPAVKQTAITRCLLPLFSKISLKNLSSQERKKKEKVLMKNYLPPSCYYCLTSLYHLLTASSHFFMDLDWVEEWSLPEIPKLMSKGAAVLAETMLEGSAVGGIKNWEDIYFRLQVSLRPFLGSRKKKCE